nr:helix-turn-helix domain-containing protein [Actinomadura rubrisoli]
MRDSPGSCTRPPSATPSVSPTPLACSARSPTSSPYARSWPAGACTSGSKSGLLSGISDDPGTKTSGKSLGRPTALGTGQAAEVVEAYRSGTAIKALARQHHVAPKTIRRILDNARARELPDQLDTLPARR